MLLLALIGLAIYLVLRKKEKAISSSVPEILPAHVRAVKLDKLKQEKDMVAGSGEKSSTAETDILRVLHLGAGRDTSYGDDFRGILRSIRKVS